MKEGTISWIYKVKKSYLIELARKVNLSIPFNVTCIELKKLIIDFLKEQPSEVNSWLLGVYSGILETAESVNCKRQVTFTMECKLEFCHKTDDWGTFIERFELFLEVNDVPISKHVPLLLTKVSPDTYKLIKELCVPVVPKEKSFKELVMLMTNHVNPQPSESMERCKFHLVKQEDSERFSDFVAKLKKCSLHCNFANLNEAIRDQIVCGINDKEAQIDLFKEKNLTLDKAVEIGTSWETAKANAIRSNSMMERSNSQVYKIKEAGPNEKRQGTSGSTNQKRFFRNVKCYCCGEDNHLANSCKHRSKQCNFCGKIGHLERVCFKKKGARQSSVKLCSTEEDEEVNLFNHEFYNVICNVNIAENVKAEPLKVRVLVNNTYLAMEVDTGSYVSIISKCTADKYFSKIEIQKSRVNLVSYNKTRMPVLGVLSGLAVSFNGVQANLDCFVMPGEGTSLIGRKWLKILNSWPLLLPSAGTVLHYIDKIGLNNLKAQYTDLFSDSPATYTGKKVKLLLKGDAKPVQLKPYRVPFALKTKVTDEINRLISLGNLEPVKISEWATPVIPVIKGDGVRLCGNFKLTVNPCLIIKRHPLPLKEKIFVTLQNGNKWSQLDLKHAFMQIEVDESCRNLLTIITENGLFRYKKLPEGIASSPGECQDILESILEGIPFTEIFIDNIYCTGRTDEEHLHILHEILNRLNKAGLRLNINKCDIFKGELEILGYVLDHRGLRPAPSKVSAINDIPIPTNAKETMAFLGLVNYYDAFLDKRAANLKPLYDLCRKQKFVWNKGCNDAFQWVKNQITSERVLTLYNPEEQLVLACDASNVGLSAILSHRFRNGEEKPIAFASKIIPNSEKHRAIIDKEAAAIVFGFKKFYQYICGSHIILKTDHEPLKFIFGNSKTISLTVQNRLQRWSYFLSSFSYTIEVVRSSRNSNCDALSRLPIHDNTDIFDKELSNLNYIEDNTKVVTCKIIAQETKKDRSLNKILKFVTMGWPDSDRNLTEYEKKLFNKKHELGIEKNCLLWGLRIIIPKRLQPLMLDSLHESHFGIVRMKQMARSIFWWPNIDTDIENAVNSCTICLATRKDPPKTSHYSWPYPNRPWSRIHIDLLGPIHKCMFLVVIDAYSKWPEIFNMGSNTTSERVIRKLKEVFGRLGLPDHIVSDNGRQFVSNEFKMFLSNNGIMQSFSPPYHPATNGAAENMVGTFKDKVNKMVNSGKSLESAVDLFLFDFRTTSHATTKVTPAYLVYGRELKTRFSLLRTSPGAKTDEVLLKRGKPDIRKIDFRIGEQVYVNCYASKRKIPGIVEDKLSPVTYKIKLDNGNSCKRHIDQMIKCKINQCD